MSNKIVNVLVFAVGAAIGSTVTYTLVKKKYERIAQEEIDSVKDAFFDAKRMASIDWSELEDCDPDELEEYEAEEEYDPEENEMIGYTKLASHYAGTNDDEEGEGDAPYVNGPYVISPEEFRDGNYDFNPVSLTYYSDGVLADDWGVEVDIDEVVGEESLHHFGEYVDDVVHVRNERLERDYEIVRDDRSYSEVNMANSHADAYENV